MASLMALVSIVFSSSSAFAQFEQPTPAQATPEEREAALRALMEGAPDPSTIKEEPEFDYDKALDALSKTKEHSSSVESWGAPRILMVPKGADPNSFIQSQMIKVPEVDGKFLDGPKTVNTANITPIAGDPNAARVLPSDMGQMGEAFGTPPQTPLSQAQTPAPVTAPPDADTAFMSAPPAVQAAAQQAIQAQASPPTLQSVPVQQLPQPGFAQPGFSAVQPGALATYPVGQQGQPVAQQGFPVAQPGYPVAQPGYVPQGYPVAQPGYVPQSYPVAQPGYVPQSYPVAQPGYVPQSYPVAQPGYPVAQPGYPVAQPGYGQQGYPAQGFSQPVNAPRSTMVTKDWSIKDWSVPSKAPAATPAKPAGAPAKLSGPATKNGSALALVLVTPMVMAGENAAVTPEDSVALYNKAVKLHLSGQLDEAVEAYGAAIAANPELGPAFCNRGLIFNQKRLYTKALDEFHKALAIDPKDAITYNGIGAALRAQKDMAGAIKNWQTAITLDPKLATAHYNLGTAYELQKDYEKAVDSYDDAIAHDAKLGEAYYRKGLLLIKLDKIDDAKECLSKSLKASSASATAEYSASARSKLAQLEAAEATR
jgi:FOG: TPR repeat